MNLDLDAFVAAAHERANAAPLKPKRGHPTAALSARRRQQARRWRSQGADLAVIAARLGVTKSAVWQMLRRGA